MLVLFASVPLIKRSTISADLLVADAEGCVLHQPIHDGVRGFEFASEMLLQGDDHYANMFGECSVCALDDTIGFRRSFRIMFSNGLKGRPEPRDFDMYRFR